MPENEVSSCAREADEEKNHGRHWDGESFSSRARARE
jgi:hypothetical protein